MSSFEQVEEIVLQILNFVQCCVEGHYSNLQNYFREQHNTRNSIDLVNTIADLLKSYYFDLKTIGSYNNIMQCLSTLNELGQGPCLLN